MKRFIKKSFLSIKNVGFTLIELLVVVLIIGILAAVALPQYQLVVAKNRIARYLPFMRVLQKSQEQYYLANGQYSTSIRELDIECQQYGTGSHQNWCYLDSKGRASVHIDEGRYFILTDSQVKDIALLFFYHPTSKASCYAYRDNKLAERICQSLSGKANTGSIANAKTYSLF